MKYLWVVFALGCAWPLVASAQEGTAGRTPCDSLGMLSIALSGERCTDSVLTFSAAGLPGLQQYEWNLGDGENFSTAELQRAYPQPGLYSAVLIAIDEAGCVFSANISFEVAFCGPAGGCQYNFPNAFTPNGDGLNDTFGLLSSCPPRATAYRFLTAGAKKSLNLATLSRLGTGGAETGLPLPQSTFTAQQCRARKGRAYS